MVSTKASSLTLLLVACSLATSCARFKVDKLNGKKVFSSPLSRAGLNYRSESGITLAVPRKVAVVGDWVVVSEPSNHRVKIFKGNELKTEVVGRSFAESDKPRDNKVRTVINDQLQIPGYTVAGSDEDFFVLNYYSIPVPQKKKKKKGKSPPPTQRGYYKILHFDVKGGFIGLVGRQSRPELPFENILWFDTDTDNNLWVLYRQLDSVVLENYAEGKLKHTIKQKKCNEILFKDAGLTPDLTASCEQMYPFYGGEKVLLIGRVDRKPDPNNKDLDGPVFQYRVFKMVELDDESVTEIFAKLNDPEDLPYIPYDSDHIIIWQTLDAKRVKFALYNLDGDLVNNLQISLTGRRSAWRYTYATLSGEYYSIRIADKSFQIFRWN